MTDKKVRTALQRTYIDYQEWARENNIYQEFLSLSPRIYGFVYFSPFNNYYVIINKNITLELQKEVYLHEIEHILYDLPEVSYIVGVDMQHTEMENKADQFAKKKVNNFFG
ncbi:hypothetical protein DFR79_106108 [Halanaerobium saccharolyticum]|jgi:Zn-dependent peptidase ImmA (M78 family)|uniref:IrrE N-terminal-like domain-containing protein n=1 Tax=Halanaerobium saccharolyticum TaxID=43595 RepID=A0A4R6LW21_9FIRM|nr:hypothetical protein [Halanaerobium saccharolyticum]TDO92295.1 hypothetical protein DFR79_106108 [Halanaerobium saccharolyticum]